MYDNPQVGQFALGTYVQAGAQCTPPPPTHTGVMGEWPPYAEVRISYLFKSSE